MAVFEISSKKNKDGKRHFKAVLYKLQPPECVVNNVGTNGFWNENGITFIEEYSKKQLDSIKDMSITCDFIDEEKTEISAHGDTGEFTKDGLPIFEANIIGHFNKGYIGDYEENGDTYRVVYGEGILDEFRNPKYIEILDKNISQGIFPSGSIEIFRPTDSEHIEYLNGKFEQGRVPINFIHSGYTLVLTPADKTAKIIELNSKNKESEDTIMDEKTLALIIDSVKNTISESNSKNSEYENKIVELNDIIADKDNKIVELTTNIEKVQKALDDLKSQEETHWNEKRLLEEEIAKMRVEKRIAEMNSALEGFSDDEKNYAKTEIDNFNADPMNVEINSIVEKIYSEVGKKALADEKAKREQEISELNSKKSTIVDVYGDIFETSSSMTEDEMSIY